MPEPLIKGSFIISSEDVQEHTHWVFHNISTINSQFSPISPQTLNELIEHMPEYIVVIFLSIL